MFVHLSETSSQNAKEHILSMSATRHEYVYARLILVDEMHVSLQSA